MPVKTKVEFTDTEVQLLMGYINYVVKGEGLVQAENALHLTRVLKVAYDKAAAKKVRRSSPAEPEDLP